MTWHQHLATPSRGDRAAASVLLSISPWAHDHSVLRAILDQVRWQIEEAYSCDVAFRLVSSRPVSVIITNDALPDGDWMRILAYSDARPEPPVIVASRLADERLWAEVLNLGGYDVLVKPFVADEVRRVVSLAGSSLARKDKLVRQHTVPSER